MNVALTINCNRPRTSESLNSSRGEYFKRFEHDEVPVKDSADSYLKPKIKVSLTNTDLEKLETRIFENVSQELPTDNGSQSSLESNMKIFKTTVEQIFASFYTSMRDFDNYKSRFHAILDRGTEGSIDDMEDFIKDMFEHIMSSENSASDVSSPLQKTMDPTLEPGAKGTVSCSGSTRTEPSSTAVLDAYKNESYLTDSTPDEFTPRETCIKVEEILNIFFLGDNPSVEIKMNDRNLLSEINLGEPCEIATASSIASADNFKKLDAKRLEVQRYIRQQNHNIPDRNIPVKVSCAKKNIYLNEDFGRTVSSEPSRSLISKICNILCKKFRKSSFVSCNKSGL